MKVVELFAGVGGFRLGLERASLAFDTIWVNQWEPGKKKQHAFECYNKHFNSSVNTNIDIAEAKKYIPKHDFLVAGFPCQDYSVARTGAEGIKGKKGELWWEIRDIIEEKRPSFVLLENVDRLLKSPSKQRGRDFGMILYCLWKMGYRAEWRVINAAEYGFPQKRRRIFIFASRGTDVFCGLYLSSSKSDIIYKHGLFARSFPVRENESLSLGEINVPLGNFDSLYELSEKFSLNFANAGLMEDGLIFTEKVEPEYNGKFTVLADILEKGLVDERYYITKNIDKWRYLKGSKKELRHKPNGEPYHYTEGAVPFPDNVQAPARTMLTSESSVNRSSHVIYDEFAGKERILTPVECERINGFPDNWTNTGMPEKFRYFVMGNALVVDVIEQLGKALQKLNSG